MNSRILIYLLTGIITFTACKTQNPVLQPEEKINLPEKFSNSPADTLTLAALPWKQFFPDKTLQGYIQTALQNNHSFQQTVERMQQASVVLKMNKNILLPEINGTAQTGVQKFGDYTMDGAGNKGTAGVPDPYTNFGLGVVFSWEADIWGKLNNKKRAAYSRWMSSVEATRLAQSVLISELAANYFRLIELDKQQSILENEIKKYDEFVGLTTILKKEGEATQLAVDQFETRKLKLEGLVLKNKLEIEQYEHAIALLTGVLPFEVKRMNFEEMKNISFTNAYGIPVQLLQYRPDIRSSEHLLLASKADVSSARAAMFPSLRLGAGAGWDSWNLGKLFKSPASLVYDLSAGITLPIFKQKELKTIWENSKSDQRIALSQYHETVIKAYIEVTDLISEIEITRQRVELKDKELTIHQRSVDNANELFRLYFVDYLEVLSAQEGYLECELEQTSLISQKAIAQSMLYRALGGGYSEGTHTN